jgi:peptidoglycan/xylan/chitin deacetylase (PgdA/CDA1 family)
VQATLTRAGTAVLIVLALALVLATTDTLSGIVSATFPDEDGEVGTTQPFTHYRGEGREVEAVIPLGRREINVPILMYHYVQDLPPVVDRLTYNLTVTPKDFNTQLSWLRVHGYSSVTFDDLRAYFMNKRPLPSKPVVITLDDGYRDLYTNAYPILEQNGFKAVAYIVTGFIDHARYVTTDMILEMARYGIEIASHTVDHANVSRLSPGNLSYELVQSKEYLEHLIGHPVVDFAYPSGRFSSSAEAGLKAAGYSTAVTELYSTELTWPSRYTWPRDRVWGGEGLIAFVRSLGPVEPFILVTQIA